MPRLRNQDVLTLFERSSLLGAFEPAERELLAKSVRYREFARDEVIFGKGSEGSTVLLVVSGRVKIVSVAQRTGSELILNLIEPGKIFGEMALIDGKPRSADAIAASPTEILSLSRRDFLEALGRNLSVSLRMMEILSDRVRQATSFAEDAILLDARTRLFNRIMGLAEQYGGAVPGAPDQLRIKHGLSQREIGEHAGLTRVSVNRQLALWRGKGLISTRRGELVLLDIEGLRADVEDYEAV